MISRRVFVNLGAFVALFGLLSAWALTNVVKLDRIERPYEIVAEFESTPGLQPNVQATYLGVPVGSVDSVRLEQGHVRVAIDIDRGVEIPEGISAAVRRKSAVGEPYIAFDPPEEAASARMIDPTEGYTVPRERTSVPLSYGQLFKSVDQLVSSVPADDLGTLIGEMATALEGRGDEIRQILASSEDLTTTLATRTEVFDDLASDLTTLTHTLASKADGIGSSLDDLSALMDTLAASSGDLQRVMAETPRLATQVQDLLEVTYADLSCSFADIGYLLETVGTDAHVADIVRLLQAAAGARSTLELSIVQPGDGGAEGPYITGSFGALEDSPAAYSPKASLPAPAPITTCAAPGAPAVGTPGDAGAVGPGEGAGPRPTDDVNVPERAGPDGPDLPASSTKNGGGGGLGWLLVLLAAAIAALLYATRPWRRLPFLRRSDSDDV